MMKKYQKKDIYLRRKGRKLLIISDYYKSITTEYQKITNFLGNTPNQPYKSKAEKSVKK